MTNDMLSKTGILLMVALALLPGLSAAESAPTDKPKVWISPEIEIESEPESKPQPPVKVALDAPDEKEKKPGWFSRNKWWVLLGTAVVSGAAAALAAGGDSGSGGGQDNGTGIYDAGW